MHNEDILQSILSLLAIDGKIERQELQFFAKMCQEFDVSQAIRIGLLDEIKQGRGRICIPDEKEERKQLLFYLVQAAFADGILVPKEERILQSAAHKMGIEQCVLDECIQAMGEEVQASARPATMICPKCGVVQVQSGKCRRCGIFIENYLQQEAREQGRSHNVHEQQERPEKPRLSGLPLFTKNIGASLSQFPKNYHCSWPLGTLKLYEDSLQIDLLFKVFTLHYSNIESIKSFLLQVQIFHEDPDIPKHVTLNGYKLYQTLKDVNEQYGFDLPIL